MIPINKRPAGYVLTLDDLTEAVFWSRSQSGQQKQAMVPYVTMVQFGLGEMKGEVLTPTPKFYEWFKGLEEAVYSLDTETKCLLIQWWDA